MDKTYIDVNGDAEAVALPSGEGSSMGSQWEAAGLDLDEAQDIITSVFQRQGYKTCPKNANDVQNGEMSLEEEVNSLDLKQVVIDDEEIKEMEKEQANAATAAAAAVVEAEQNASEQLTTRVFDLVDGPKQKENMSADGNSQARSDNDLLNDINSLIAPALSPLHESESPVNGWPQIPDWTGNANGRLNGGNVNAEWSSGQGKGKNLNRQALLSPSSSTGTDPRLQCGEDMSCQCSPSSMLSIKSPSTLSDISCRQGITHAGVISPKVSSGIDSFQPSPLALSSQGTSTQDKTSQKSDTVSVKSVDSVSEPSEHPENLDINTGCQMCPVIYTDDDDDGEPNDLDEHFSSGELIPHGRGSARGRPKSTQPIRSSVPCEIRPKTDLPTYSNNRIPVTVVVRKDDNKNCLELRPVICQASHNSAPSTSSGIQYVPKKTVSPSTESNQQPDSINSTSMERVEGDGPVSLIGSSHPHGVGQGRIPPHILAQNAVAHGQDYQALPQLYDGAVFAQQSMSTQPQAAMNHYIPSNHLQHVGVREQRNVQQYQEEPQYQYRSEQSAYPSYRNFPVQSSSSGICLAGHQTMVPIHQPSAYQEIHPEPSRITPSYYSGHPSEGSNLVVADPKQLEKAGIPFIIVSQTSVPNRPTAQSFIQTSVNTVHSHKPFPPQPPILQGPYGRPDTTNTLGNSPMYQHGNVSGGNRAAAQIMEQHVYNQLSKGSQPSPSRGHPQNNTQAAYYDPLPVTSTVLVECSNPTSSRVIYPIPQRQPIITGQGTALSSTSEPDIFSSSSKLGGSGMRKPVRASLSGFNMPSRSNSASISSKQDCRGIPKEDKNKRTGVWILQNSKMPTHHTHPYEPHRHLVSHSETGRDLPPKAVGLFQGAEIALVQSGSGVKKSSGNVGDSGKHKGVKKGRSSGRVKEVDTANNHQIYVNKLPGKAQRNEVPGCPNKEGDNVNKARPSSNDLAILDMQSDIIVSGQSVNNVLRKHIPEHLNIAHGQSQQDKTRSVHNDFTEVDEQLDKIMFEKRMSENQSRENQLKNLTDPLEKYSAMFDEPLFDYPTAGRSENSEVVATNPASHAKASSQVWNIDPNQYLSSKDKESLEKKIQLKNNSLEKYLRMGKTNSNRSGMSDPNSQASLENRLMGSEVTQELPTHCDDSLLLQQLDHSHSQRFTRPPEETGAINILAWREQSMMGRQEVPVVPKPDPAEPQFDLANPSAQDFPQLLHSLTAFVDEEMRSASLEPSGSFRNPTDKECPSPSHGPSNISTTSYPSQYPLANTSGVRPNLLNNDICKIPQTSYEHCFRKPHHPAIKQSFPANGLVYGSTNMQSQQTFLSASISHPQPLMVSSVAVTSSQPMSSVKGDSDVSMQSDLSRHSRQDRSMSSVDSKLHQIPEFYEPSHPTSAVHNDESKSSRCNKRETNKVKEWLEKQSTFLNQSDSKVSGLPKNSQEHSRTLHAITSNIPKHLDCIDHQDLLPQHLAVRQQNLHQDHQVLQQIPPPSSPPFEMNSPFQDELDFDPYVVPGFSPSDLLPRCGSGNSVKPSSRPQSGSQSIKGRGPAPTSSSNSQIIGANTSSNRVTVSVHSPLPVSCKEALLSQKLSKNNTAATLTTCDPINSVTPPSSSQHVALSSPSVSSNGSHSRSASAKPPATVSSNYSSADSSQVVKTKESCMRTSSSPSTSHKASDMLKVGERMKTSVKISHASRQHRESADADAHDKDEDKKEEEEEEDDVEVLGEEEEKAEEEELSFTGSDVFRPDNHGETILHCLIEIPTNHFDDLASAPGFEEAVNSSNKAQETPLFVGVHNRRPDVTRFLMKKGADASIPCISPANAFRNEPLLQSAIHEAAELGDLKTLYILLQSEDVDIDLPRPGSGQTPLMVALHVHSFAHRNSSADRARVVKLLLEQGASMTIQDAVEGKTPFMYAIQSRDVGIVNTFFRLMDADEARDAVTMRTSRNATCLHFAAGLSNFDRSEKMELIRILILNGADTSCKNAEGETPRDWAREEIDEVLKKLVPGR